MLIKISINKVKRYHNNIWLNVGFKLYLLTIRLNRYGVAVYSYIIADIEVDTGNDQSSVIK